MTIKGWQMKVDSWIKEIGVRYFDVKTNTLLLSEEVGEFSRLIARSHGEQSFKKDITKEEVKKRIAEEMADIIFVTTCLANQLDIDLTQELEKNIEKKTNRDNVRHRNNPKLK